MEAITLVQRVEYVKRACTGKTVLHLGCTDWPYTEQRLGCGTLLHLQLQEIAACVCGIDDDETGLETLRRRGVRDVFRGNLENLSAVDVDRTFDVILAGEVIEHLSNPGLFLRGVRRFMSADSVLIITTINAYCGFRMIRYSLRGRGGRAEPVHPDHVAYYSYATLRQLLSRERYTVRRFMFYDLGPEHRPHHPWYLNMINDLCVGFAAQAADGIIAECTLAE